MVQIPDPSKKIDYVDFQGLGGGFNEIYFGQHHLTVDGKALFLTRDFRLVPAPWGARLLFIRPINAHELVFTPVESIKVADSGLKTFVGTYHLSVGRPRLKHDVGCPTAAPVCSPS